MTNKKEHITILEQQLKIFFKRSTWKAFGTTKPSISVGIIYYGNYQYYQGLWRARISIPPREEGLSFQDKRAAGFEKGQKQSGR